MFLYHNNSLTTEANISIENRGFLFGDGAFETCLIYQQKIINLAEHLKRLSSALEYLAINYDFSQLQQQAENLVKLNNLEHGILKIQISRDVGSVGYLPAQNCPTTTILQNFLPRKIPQHIKLIMSDRGLCGSFPFKSSNSLPYVLAKLDAQKKLAFDSILVNHHQHICETGSANIFWVKNGHIFTSYNNLVLGLVRNIICQNFVVHLVAENWQSLQGADEVFITNSIILLKSIDTIEFANKIIKNYQQTKVAQKIASFLQEKLLL